MIVAAIDIGTTFSACVFSFRSDYEKDPLHIDSIQWTAVSRASVSITVPTVVMLDKSKKFLAFGYEAEAKYFEFALDEGHHVYYYFRGSKMLLHETMDVTRQTMIKDDNGKEMPALEIFSLVIKNLKDHLSEFLNSQAIGLTVGDIHWVLTVPAIWTEPGKQFMREAAEKAGISGEHLSLCLKPEAASLLCQCCLTVELKDNEKGAKYMVLDLEDGTAEITCHQKDAHGSLLEQQTPRGGSWIGPCVDEAFNQFLIKIIGAHHFRKFQKENKLDVLDMLSDFDLKKTNIKNETIKKVTLKIPVDLFESFEKDTEEKIGDVIKQTAYEGKLTCNGNKLRMEANLFRALFSEPKTHLIKHMKSILTKSHLKDVNTILMVGSFSESPIMQSAVKDAFPGMTVFAPHEPGLAAVKGAVIYGHRIITGSPIKIIE